MSTDLSHLKNLPLFTKSDYIFIFVLLLGEGEIIVLLSFRLSKRSLGLQMVQTIQVTVSTLSAQVLLSLGYDHATVTFLQGH